MTRSFLTHLVPAPAGSSARTRWTALLSCGAIATLALACSSSDGTAPETPDAGDGPPEAQQPAEPESSPEGEPSVEVNDNEPTPEPDDTRSEDSEPGDAGPDDVAFRPEQEPGASFLEANTVSMRVSLPLTPQGTLLSAERLAVQLEGYDPGSLLRCSLDGQAAYDEALDGIGGVSWGYGVTSLEDLSKPDFLLGFPEPILTYPGEATLADGASVEIVKPDVVAVTESAAVFYSKVHGLLLVDTSGAAPSFKCAAAVPGRVDQFFFHQGHLVSMTQSQNGRNAHLLHFKVEGADLGFVEDVDLGETRILDSRRFNNRLVFYTDHQLHPPSDGAAADAESADIAIPVVYSPAAGHRALRVFQLGDALQEEMFDTLIDDTPTEDEFVTDVMETRPEPGTVVRSGERFGTNMWASDHYFVVTQERWEYVLDGFESRTYSVCTESHTVEVPYEYCWTEYETRPNPDYVEPDNSGGDRGCQGKTLSDCLRGVAKVANKTIRVPVGRQCEEQIRRNWICDARESRTVEYPVYHTEISTPLFIYEYTEEGFRKLDSTVHEIVDEGLEDAASDAALTSLTTSAEAFDLAVPGSVQTLYFQNGYLYVISEGVLQVYVMGGGSLVRSSTLQVVNDSLQSTLFSSDRLILSDFGYRGGDHSTLKVVDLSNPGFPKLDAQTRALPGGHRSIIASDFGIFTVGSVNQFEGQTINALKLGLFSEPYVEETAYLILGTDLTATYLGIEESQLFNGASQRMLLPYWGYDELGHQLHRVGLSHLTADAIVSEGAVALPEPATRIRALFSDEESYLSFADNSIEWLTPNGNEWDTTGVLEYFVPTAVYRLTEDNDYVELQKLGNRCQLFFSNAKDINQRDTGRLSEQFDCFQRARAFDNQLLFGDTAIEFGDSASVRVLDAEEIATTNESIQNRNVCLLSLDIVPNAEAIDYFDLPEDVEPLCVTPEEYQRLYREALASASASTEPAP